MKLSQHLLRRAWLAVINLLFKTPGAIIEIFCFCGFMAIGRYTGFEIFNILRNRGYRLSWQTIPLFLGLFSQIYVFTAICGFAVIMLLILATLFSGGEGSHQKSLTDLEILTDKMIKSKTATAIFFGGPTYFIIKFLFSLVISLMTKLSPFLIFSLSPHPEIKISEARQEKIERKLLFMTTRRAWTKWDWLIFDLIRATGYKPAYDGPKGYAKLISKD